MLSRVLSITLLLGLYAAAITPARAQDTVVQRQQNVSELQKLDAAFTFLRGRNAQDYSVKTPNGIDVGKYVNVGGIELWL
jgi:hypothetical protein